MTKVFRSHQGDRVSALSLVTQERAVIIKKRVVFACVCALLLSSSLASAAEGTAKDSGRANAELQLYKNINQNLVLYVDGLVGIGGDRPYDWGVGVGVSFNY